MAVRLNLFGQKTINFGSETIVSKAPIVARSSAMDAFEALASIHSTDGVMSLVPSLTRKALVAATTPIVTSGLIELNAGGTLFVRQSKGIAESVMMICEIKFGCTADAAGTLQRELSIVTNDGSGNITSFVETIEEPFVKAAPYYRTYVAKLCLTSGTTIDIVTTTAGTSAPIDLTTLTVNFYCD